MPVQEYRCGIHKITYTAFKPGCPVCELERENKALRETNRGVRTENRYLREQLQSVQIDADSIAGYRAAAAVLDDNDRAFIKTVLYMYRDQGSVALKPMRAEREVKTAGKISRKSITVGFVVVPRSADPYTHECTSIGGLALADMFEESNSTIGNSQATKNMVRGLSHLLPGSARRD